MSIKDLKAEVKIKDIMSTPVVTVKEEEDIVKASKLIDKHEVGCVIVIDKKGNPLGLITERDVVKRVTAKNLLPSRVKAEEIMSKPLITVESSIDITEAARKMSSKRVRRLVVVDKGKLVGIVSTRDIVDVTPALMDVIAEKSRIVGVEPTTEKTSLAGSCDKCGVWTDHLRERDGVYVCEDCATDVEEEKTVY